MTGRSLEMIIRVSYQRGLTFPGCLLPHPPRVLLPVSEGHDTLVFTAGVAHLAVRNLLIAVAANELWHLNLGDHHTMIVA